MIEAAGDEILLPPRDFALRVSISPKGARYFLDGRELSTVEAARLICAMSDDLKKRAEQGAFSG